MTPRRALAWATLANMTGSGAYIAGLTLFLVRTRGISAAAAAICILVGTLGGKFGALLFSSVIDRLGGRTTYVSTKVVTGLSMAGFMGSSSPTLLTGCLIIYGLFSAVGGSARNVIIRDIAQTDTKVYRAKLRSLANTGVVAGSASAAVLLAWDVPRGAVACIALNALSCLLCAGCVVIGVPATPLQRSQASDTGAGHDAAGAASIWRLLGRPRLLVFLVVSAVFSLMTPVLTYAIPLWISRYTYPHNAWPVGALVATNAVIVIVLQVPVGRIADRRARPTAVMVAAGVTLGVGLTIAGTSALTHGPLSLAIVWVAVVLVSLAEVLFSAGTTELLFAPDLKADLSRTSSLFTFACAIGEAAGPSLLLAIALRPTSMGWLIVAAIVWTCSFLYLRMSAVIQLRQPDNQAAAA
ncbi:MULTISPECIES: MFS transporter [unclassified Streptomyces]|nr:MULTISPECIES: MFS transporter [unclassified Streptomyces]MCX5054608.1 MFS transporter [Streptomyces sp. NBC_00474]